MGAPIEFTDSNFNDEVIKSETNKAVQEMMKMMQNPEMMKALVEFKKRTKSIN